MSANLKEINLLAVDDNFDILEVIRDFLGEEVNGLFLADTLESAKEVIDLQKLDCVLLDIDLEGRNGGEVLGYLKNSENNRETAVVVVSGVIDEDFIQKYEDHHIKMVMKPFTKEELLSALNQVL